jgi:hypothetical protein
MIRLKYIKPSLYLLFYVSVKLDLQPKEEYNLWFLKKTVLRGIYRPLKKEVTGR